MKKAIFVMVAASAMLASCSNEEALQVNKGRAIEFRHGMTSRAADLNAGNLQKFMVSAWVGGNQYFGPVEFTKGEGENATFSSETSYYWPGDGSEVSFTAFAPYDLDNATIDNGSVKVSEFTVSDDKAAQVDFIVGEAKGSNTNQATGVQIQFAHMLSQIEIKAKSSNTTYDFEISEVKLVNIPNKGSFDGTTWTILGDADKATYGYTLPEAVTLTADAIPLMAKDNVNSNLILIPQQLTAWEPTPNRPALDDATAKNIGAYIAVKLKVTASDGKVQIFPFSGKDKDGNDATSVWAAVPVDTNWEVGKKYTYILDFTNGAGWVAPGEPVNPEEPIFNKPIKFSVLVSDWDTEDKSLTPGKDTEDNSGN